MTFAPISYEARAFAKPVQRYEEFLGLLHRDETEIAGAHHERGLDSFRIEQRTISNVTAYILPRRAAIRS